MRRHLPLAPSIRPALERLEDRSNPSTAFLETDLISDQPGVAPITDAHLVNAWGIALNPSGAFWVSSNGADLSAVYRGDANGQPLAKAALEVSIPGGSPTGQVFNATGDFVISSGSASIQPSIHRRRYRSSKRKGSDLG